MEGETCEAGPVARVTCAHARRAPHGGRDGARRYSALSSSVIDCTEDFASPKSIAVLGL
jgi:hypothetical protein